MGRIQHKAGKGGIELRACAKPLELRATDGEAPTLVGYGAVFDSWSEDLGSFREIIRPGAFEKTLSEARDVKSLWNHGFGGSDLLGRTSSGTLQLGVDDVGLRYELALPDTQLGRDLGHLVSRGDVAGSSFEFRTVKDRFTSEEGEMRRELLEVQLFEVGPVIDPAYPAANVSLRSLPGPDEIEDRALLRRLYEAQGLTGDKIQEILSQSESGHGPARTVPLSTLQRMIQLEELDGAA